MTHNARNGKPFAGGYPLSAPLGKVYWPLTVWGWVFGPGPKPYAAPAGTPVEVARGAYLVVAF